jgi:predicted flap endonuclease-1-like 5' DNA nuclease
MEIVLWLVLGFALGLGVGWYAFRGRYAEGGTGEVSEIDRIRFDRDAVAAERDRLAKDLEACNAARRSLEEGRVAPVMAGGGGVPALANDELRKIIGIGPENEKRLKAAGITSFVQIANWSDEDVHRMETILAFEGRIARERWIEQAKLLAAGELEEFAIRFPTASAKTNT